MKRTDFYVVVPVYNEEKRLLGFLRKLKKETKQILLVDDGSTDKTTKIIRKEKLRPILHAINLGKGAAMKTGAETAWKLGVNKVIYLDGDGQHDPKIIPAILEKLDKGYDMVFTARKMSRKIPLIRYLGNKIGTGLINIFFGINRSDPFCGCFGMSKIAYQLIKWNSQNYEVETEIVARLSKRDIRYTEIPISTVYLDKYKGITVLDALKILISIPKFKFI
jgi:glycosyltransferase involved in cell wall biosynthesis